MRDHVSAGMAALLALRFLAELGLLAALAWAGSHLAGGGAGAVVLAVLLPATAAVGWGLWVAPRASRRLDDPARAVVEGVLFFATFVLLTRSDPATVPAGLLLLAAFVASMPARRVRL